MPIIHGKLPKYPATLWAHFYQLTQIPRATGQEEQVRAYIQAIANQYELPWRTDTVGNLVVFLRGSGRQEDAEPLLVQNHLDVVIAAKNKKFDYLNERLEVFSAEGWVGAEDINVGAENGIGCAIALALITEEPENHPPFELLFTVSKEDGLKGVKEIDVEALCISAKRLLNLDTNEWGSIYIGSAGRKEFVFSQEDSIEPAEPNTFCYEIKVNNFSGGHSGLDIHRKRQSAIRFLVKLLSALKEDFSLVQFSGGEAHNAIPRSASAIIHIHKENDDLYSAVKDYFLTVKKSFSPEDKGARFYIEHYEPSLDLKGLKAIHTRLWLKRALYLPHGVLHWYQQSSMGALVSCSSNLANLQFEKGKTTGLMSLRFTQDSDLKLIDEKVADVASMDFKVLPFGGYPHWKMNKEGSQFKKISKIYRKRFGRVMEVKTVHARLEPSVLSEKIPGLNDIVSIGMTIEDGRLPTECVSVLSVRNLWKLLVAYFATKDWEYKESNDEDEDNDKDILSIDSK